MAVGERAAADGGQVEFNDFMGDDSGAFGQAGGEFQLDAMALVVVDADGVDLAIVVFPEPPEQGGRVHAAA